MVLVSSGGLGREVHPVLRAATLPGSELVLPLIAPALGDPAPARRSAAALGKLGLHVRSDVTEMARGYASLNDAEARDAFRHTLRAVVDPGGQRISALDRLYLAEDMPVLLLWGANDPIIPAEHGRRARRADPRQPLRRVRGLRATGRSSTTPSASPTR